MPTHSIYDSVASLPVELWNRCLEHPGADVWMDPRLLSAVETTMADATRLRFVIFFGADEQPIAWACLSTFRVDLAILANRRLQGVLARVRRAVPHLLQLPVLFCGLPVSGGQKSLVISPSGLQHDVVNRLDGVMREVGQHERARVLAYKEFTGREHAYLAALEESGYRRVATPLMHRFDGRFADFDDYVAALRSHYRQDVRRSTRKLEREGIRAVRWTDPDEIERVYTEEVHRLYRAVVDRSETKLELLPRGFFVELAKRLPHDVSLTALIAGDRIVAFNWAIRGRDVYQFLFCGVDYSLNRRAHLYFNVMYAEIGHALRARRSTVLLGQTSDVFKARLGCRPEPLYAYVAGAGRVYSWLIRSASRWIFPEPSPPPAYRIYKSTPRTALEPRARRRDATD